MPQRPHLTFNTPPLAITALFLCRAWAEPCEQAWAVVTGALYDPESDAVSNKQAMPRSPRHLAHVISQRQIESRVRPYGVWLFLRLKII